MFSQTWKDLLDVVRIIVYECPINAKLSLIRYDKHLVFFHIWIRSYGKCVCNRLGLFRAIRDGVLQGVIVAQFSPCIIHAEGRIFLCLDKVGRGQDGKVSIKQFKQCLTNLS